MILKREGDTYGADVSDPSGRGVSHLVVEQAPDGLWTWTTWRPGARPKLARYRTLARPAREAMHLAGQTAQSEQGLTL
jgi:hypothetical protein